MAVHTAAELHELSLDEPTIASALDHIAEKRANQPPLARHIAAEHSPAARRATTAPLSTPFKATVPSAARGRRTPPRYSRAKTTNTTETAESEES